MLRNRKPQRPRGTATHPRECTDSEHRHRQALARGWGRSKVRPPQRTRGQILTKLNAVSSYDAAITLRGVRPNSSSQTSTRDGLWKLSSSFSGPGSDQHALPQGTGKKAAQPDAGTWCSTQKGRSSPAVGRRGGPWAPAGVEAGRRMRAA